MSDIYWLNQESRLFLERGYLQPGVTPEQRIRQIAERAEELLNYPGFADRFESYMHRGWYSLASPIWSNFGAGRGLPVSCNGSFIPDDTGGILEKGAEIGVMTKHGAGTSAYFGAIRGRGTPIKSGGQSDGTTAFAKLLFEIEEDVRKSNLSDDGTHVMHIFDQITEVISQSNVRRGSMAAYLPVDHPDIDEFLDLREEGNRVKRLSIGVCISDQWLTEMKAGDKAKRTIWGKLIKKRFESGYPYVFFTDNVNRGAPQAYRDKGMTIHASNLCSEIALPSSADESFVCVLSSMNLLHYDQWKDTDAVETLTYFLDAVNSEYVEKTADVPFMEAAHRFAKRHRALGVGVLGWHSYLQSRMIPFESMEAKFLNTAIHRLIRDKSQAASREMATRYGEPEVLTGYGLRNTTTMAIAPTTSSSFILGQVSQGIEPENSCYYVKDLAKGRFTYRNPYLQDVLKAHGQDKPEIWKSILLKGGSVQHLTFLTQNERDVFKTFGEISQKEIVLQAAARQKFIDQSQSLNLMIPPNTPPKQVSELMLTAHELGVKSLYYQRSGNPAQALALDVLACKSCEG